MTYLILKEILIFHSRNTATLNDVKKKFSFNEKTNKQTNNKTKQTNKQTNKQKTKQNKTNKNKTKKQNKTNKKQDMTLHFAKARTKLGGRVR